MDTSLQLHVDYFKSAREQASAWTKCLRSHPCLPLHTYIVVPPAAVCLGASIYAAFGRPAPKPPRQRDAALPLVLHYTAPLLRTTPIFSNVYVYAQNIHFVPGYTTAEYQTLLAVSAISAYISYAVQFFLQADTVSKQHRSTTNHPTIIIAFRRNLQAIYAAAHLSTHPTTQKIFHYCTDREKKQNSTGFCFFMPSQAYQ